MIKKLLATIILCFTILHIQAQPNIEWQKVFGGTHQDEAYSIQQTADGGYIVAGQTSSTDGDIIGNHGGYDFGIVKLAMPTGIKELEFKTTFQIYPNPAKDALYIKANKNFIGSNYTVFNIIGQKVLSGKIIKENTLLDISDLSSGTYFINVKTVEGLFNSFKILKN